MRKVKKIGIDWYTYLFITLPLFPQIYEYRDVHSLILGALNTYVETDDNILHVFKSGCIQRLQTYLDVTLPGMKTNCLAVLTKMSFSVTGRQVSLYMT